MIELVDNSKNSLSSPHSASVTMRVQARTFVTSELLSLEFLSSIGYLRVEFPSEFWYFPNVATTVTHSLEQFFVGILPKDDRIEHVYWAAEDDILKIWTVIPEPDFLLEAPLYEAQMAFIEKFPEYQCDFSVIYRFGKSLNDIAPQGGRLVL